MPRIHTLLAGFVLVPAIAHGGEVITVDRDLPDLDRWFYNFNFTPGVRVSAVAFGSFGPETGVENRHAFVLVGWDTAGEVPTGLGADRYLVHSATLTLMTNAENDTAYDPSFDPWQTYIGLEDPADPDAVPDADAGRPIELYVAGFRNGFTPASFPEDGPYGDAEVFQRNVFTGELGSDGALFDVGDSVRERFDPQPIALAEAILDGTPVEPGSILVAGTELVMDVDVDRPDVRHLLGTALDDGHLRFAVSSLEPATFEGGGVGEYPSFYMKENPLVMAGIASAARLSMVVEIVETDPADVDGDGVVGVGDLLLVLAAWGPCPDPCPEDLDGDGVVGVEDLLTLLATWTV